MTTTTPRKPAMGREYGEVTRKLIALRPGRRMLITDDPERINRERGNMASRFRTATMQTGRRYRLSTQGGRLYAVCEVVTEE